MHDEQQLQSLQAATRRQFFGAAGVGLGAIGLASLLGEGSARRRYRRSRDEPDGPARPHFAPKAKRVIYLFMAGGPSQLELFDDKPKLRELARPAAADEPDAKASASPFSKATKRCSAAAEVRARTASAA